MTLVCNDCEEVFAFSTSCPFCGSGDICEDGIDEEYDDLEELEEIEEFYLEDEEYDDEDF